MTTPKSGERRRECADEIIDTADASTEAVANCIAKYFPEDDSWVERAAEEIWCESTAKGHVTQERAFEIINGCRRGEE